MQNNTVYIDILPTILASYNNSKNRSIGIHQMQLENQKTMAKYIGICMVTCVRREVTDQHSK